MKRLLQVSFLILGVFIIAGMALAQSGVKKKRPLPQDFGKTIINNYSERAGLAPVVFDHWVHRAKFTCRLCHVDIGFGMKTGTTGIRAADNINGSYCGTCHNGKTTFNGVKVFGSCERKVSGDDTKQCERCHSAGKNVRKEYDFYKFTQNFPRERFGNGVDWEKAESLGAIKLIDYIEGVSIKRQSLAVQKDFALSSKVGGMPEIIFSHKKHTVWNGCEVCHPEIFVGVKKGTTKYSMVEIFEGKYCGVCHNTVAFPLLDCQRCHTKPVQ